MFGKRDCSQERLRCGVTEDVNCPEGHVLFVEQLKSLQIVYTKHLTGSEDVNGHEIVSILCFEVIESLYG